VKPLKNPNSVEAREQANAALVAGGFGVKKEGKGKGKKDGSDHIGANLQGVCEPR